MTPVTHILLLCGGPDEERAVSVDGARSVALALEQTDWARVTLCEIPTEHGAFTIDSLRALPGDVVFPLLHGRWGEGGPLQDLLELDARPFVGAGPRAARLAMDKVATKSIAQALGLRASATCVFDPRDAACPLDFPVVVKPVHEGSTIGLFVCRDQQEWTNAHRRTAHAAKPAMIEPYIDGRELTVAVARDRALPIIEITPAEGLYDYEAKYTRNDTRYTISPSLPAGAAEQLASDSLRLARRIGAASLSRVDWLLDEQGRAWLLEINTMPGFTSHSLVPMAAASAQGGAMDLAALCRALVDDALHRAHATAGA